MDCELCRTGGPESGNTRCQRCGFDTTLPPDVKRFLISLIGFRPGELLEGRYLIDRILGYGGMSVVYKARDEVLGEEVAIKVINRGRIGDDNQLITDIRRDIVTTRKLAHPDIVKIYDFHKTDTCGFLTMEFVPGKDVASLITERGKLTEGEVCQIAEQVAEALHYAHANGVVHCDIKPANLLLAENGRVKIADFGISRVMHEESSGLTGLVVGTPAYMAPEQIRGERPGPRTDMYALGIVMWHCLMGSPPFIKGDIAYQHVHEPLPPLKDVSPDLERIVRRAASKAVDDRYPSMAVIAQELHEILRKTAMVAEATLIQPPPSGPAATILQTPPPPLEAKVRTAPSEPDGTVARTPASEPEGTVAQTSPPAPEGTVVQAPPAEQDGTQVTTPPAAPAEKLAQSPLPVAPTPEQSPPRPPEGLLPAGSGGRVPPPSGGPAAGMGQPAPVSPPASSRIRMISAAAVIVLLAGAAAWGFFTRSPEAVKPEQPLQASVGGLPPVQSPPSAVTTVPPPEPPAAAVPEAPSRKATVGAPAVVAGAAMVAVDGGHSERAPLAPEPAPVALVPNVSKAVDLPQASVPAPDPTRVQKKPALVRAPAFVPPPAPVVVASNPAPKAVSPPPASVPAPEPIRVQKKPELVRPPAAVPPPAPVAVASNTVSKVVSPPPVAVPPGEAAEIPPPAPPAGIESTPPVAVRSPAPGPSAGQAAKEPTKPAPPPNNTPPAPAPRVLDLTPIQITSLPRGRWCDVNVRAVGTGLPRSSARSEGERRLTAERSAELDAYRRIAENVKGVQVSGGSTVKDFLTTDASYKTKTDAVIRGARRVDSQKNADGTWSVVMELNLSGMCDVIQVGTP